MQLSHKRISCLFVRTCSTICMSVLPCLSVITTRSSSQSSSELTWNMEFGQLQQQKTPIVRRKSSEKQNRQTNNPTFRWSPCFFDFSIVVLQSPPLPPLPPTCVSSMHSRKYVTLLKLRTELTIYFFFCDPYFGTFFLKYFKLSSHLKR